MTVKNINEAWQKVNEIFPTDYIYDEGSTERAGYPIYRSTGNRLDYICDLGCRLEIMFSDNSYVNIYIDEDLETVKNEEITADTVTVDEDEVDEDAIELFAVDVNAIGERLITKMRVVNCACNDMIENKRTNPFYSEFYGMLQMLKTIGIDYEIIYNDAVTKMTGITILNRTFYC